jgi:hypothetical protein
MKKIQEIREKFPEYNLVEMPPFPQQIMEMESLSDFTKKLFESKYKPKFSSMKVETSKNLLPKIGGIKTRVLGQESCVI